MIKTIDHLARVRAALAAADLATPGPWRAHGYAAEVVAGDEESDDVIARCDMRGTRVSGGDDRGFRDVDAIVALRNAAGSIAAVADELERMRAALERANAQICRLVSGHSLESDVICQHLEADVAALAQVADLRAALAEAKRLGLEACERGEHDADCGLEYGCNPDGYADLRAALEAL